jgi:hypothetical protein
LCPGGSGEGRGYVEAFSQLMQADGIDTRNKSEMTIFTAVLWLHAEPERMAILREILDGMTAMQRARLNSPISARQRVEGILKARAKGGSEAEKAEGKLRESPLALARQQLVEKDREIAALRARIAKSEEGSLFDLRNDSAESIINVMLGYSSDHRATTIAKGILEGVKKRKRKPAG